MKFTRFDLVLIELKVKILSFWTKFSKKEYFSSKSEKVNTSFDFLHIRITLGTEFQLKLKISISWAKFTQKGYLWQQTEKLNISIYVCIFE